MAYLNIKTLTAAIILASSIGLLQWHAIGFWTSHAGTTGFAWSLLLEFVALWCWSHKAFSLRSLGLVASVLTLLGPMYQVSSPLIKDIYSASWSAAEIERFNKEDSDYRISEISRLKLRSDEISAGLKLYQENSTQRSGWLPAIEKAQAELSAIDKQITELSKPKTVAALPDEKLSLQKKGVILMEIVALLIFQIVSVLAILSIGFEVRKIKSSILSGTGNGQSGASKEQNILGNAGGNAAIHEVIKSNSEARKANHQIKKDDNNQAVTTNYAVECNNDNSDGNGSGNLTNSGNAGGNEDNTVATNVVTITRKEPKIEIMGGAEGDDEFILATASMLMAYLSEKGMSQSAFATRHNLSKKTLSFLANHQQRLDTAMPTAGIGFAKSVRAALGESDMPSLGEGIARQ